MTSTAQPTIVTAGQWSFQRCTSCLAKAPHGYFYTPEGDRRGDVFVTITDALDALSRAVDAGEVPTESMESLIGQVLVSGISQDDAEALSFFEDDDTMAAESDQDVSSSQFSEESAGEESITTPINFTLGENTDSYPYGEFSTEVSPKLLSVNDAIRHLYLGIALGTIPSEDRDRLVNEIKESGLPLNTPDEYRNYRLLVSHGEEGFVGRIVSALGERVNVNLILTKRDAYKAIIAMGATGLIGIRGADELLDSLDESPLPLK